MLFLFGFGKLIYICVLLTNAIAILSEDRFIARIGMGRAAMAQENVGFGAPRQNDPDSIRGKMLTLISSIRTLARVPLIVVNILIISYEILLG